MFAADRATLTAAAEKWLVSSGSQASSRAAIVGNAGSASCFGEGWHVEVVDAGSD